MQSHSRLEVLLACGLYSLSSVCISLSNKLVFSGADFNLPLAILAFQSLAAMTLLKGSELLGFAPKMPLSLGLLWQMLPVTLLFCAMLWTSGKALRHCSVPMVTVFKNVAVVGTTLWEAVRYGHKVSLGIALALCTMLAGSAVAGLGDMSADTAGLSWMCANICTTVAYLAVMKERMPTDVSSGSKTLHNNLLTLIFFSATAASSGQLRTFCERIRQQSVIFQLGLLATGVLGTVLNFSTFWCLQVANGATYAFVGATNKIPQALLGHLLFHSVITPTGWCGVSLGLCAGLVYAAAKGRESQQAAEQNTEEQKLLVAPRAHEHDEEGSADGDVRCSSNKQVQAAVQPLQADSAGARSGRGR